MTDSVGGPEGLRGRLRKPLTMTKRKQTSATAREGINFLRSLVERHNCIFHEIRQEDDIGNDAYVEFVLNENATGCCIAVQVKSGRSYRRSEGRYVIPADQSHFTYWRSHALPVAGVVFDPTERRAFWVDITSFLDAHDTRAANGPFVIPVTENAELSDASFILFRDHFLKYQARFRSDAEFGRALERYADLTSVDIAHAALHALFAFHRNRPATWVYIASTFRRFRGHPLLRQIVRVLCLLPGHGDVFWHDKNIIEEPARSLGLMAVRQLFGLEDIQVLLESIDDNGIERGTIGQSVHAILMTIPGAAATLRAIALDTRSPREIRYHALIFALDAEQHIHGYKGCMNLINLYLKSEDEPPDKSLAEYLNKHIEEHRGFWLY